MNLKIMGVNSFPTLDKEKSIEKSEKAGTSKGIQQFSSAASNACMTYGLAQINVAPIQKIGNVSPSQNQENTINLFYFSDTHGEITGLGTVAAAKEACESFLGGKDHLTVLGAGDLIAGSQTSVIQATVNTVNQLGMEASSLGNHERGRSDEKLKELSDELVPDLLAVNASDSEIKDCKIATSKVLKQNNQEFIVLGAKPLSEVESVKDIASAIDEEVANIKAQRKAEGKNPDIPVVFLSHLGSLDDRAVATASDSINLILGGHSHEIINETVESHSGNPVLLLQGGKNNEHAHIIKMTVGQDGKVSSSAKRLDFKEIKYAKNGSIDSEGKRLDMETCISGITSQLESLYGVQGDKDELLKTAKQGDVEVSKTIAKTVGEKKDVISVPVGEGYITDGQERNYSNPVSNIMADAMLSATRDKGAQVSLFNAPSLKDTEIQEDQALSNYDIMGRMLPFGGEVVIADLPIDKLYEMLEISAQTVRSDSSQLCQVGGMVYSVDAEKASNRHVAKVNIELAKKALNEAKSNNVDVAKATEKLKMAQQKYDSLPPCIEKILLFDSNGQEIKINPKAIQRGDFKGQTIRCATNDFFANETGVNNDEYGYQTTGMELTKVFEQELETVKQQNDGVMHVDHNDVRISIKGLKAKGKDEDGNFYQYPLARGINSKYWY